MVLKGRKTKQNKKEDKLHSAYQQWTDSDQYCTLISKSTWICVVATATHPHQTQPRVKTRTLCLQMTFCLLLLLSAIDKFMCVGFAVLLDTALWVWSSSEENFSGGEGIFPLELIWALTPFPMTLLDESINRGPVCAHMHSITQAQKILTFMPYECRQQKTTSMHHPRRQNVTT